MKAVEVLFPVFFMMFLGFLSRKYSWIKPEQNEGAKKIVFNILFPLLVYHVLAESKISESFVPQIIYVDALWIIIYWEREENMQGFRHSSYLPVKVEM